MKKVILIALLSILALVGCGVQNHDVTQKGSSEQSDAAALQDEFTREFIDTSVEAEEGYLQFQSKIGGDTMLYSENAVADPMTYETSGGTFELMKFGSEKNNNLSLLVYASYNVLGFVQSKSSNQAVRYEYNQIML